MEQREREPASMGNDRNLALAAGSLLTGRMGCKARVQARDGKRDEGCS